MSVRCTVLLPVHNGMPYLPEALDSILNQSEKDLAIIVLNDGSTDGTQEYLRSVPDSRLKVLTTERIGLPAVLNFGLAAVATEFVARMDADDIAMPDRIKKQCDFLETQPACILVGSAIRYIGEQGNRLPWKTSVPIAHSEIMLGLNTRKSVLFHPSIVCRTDAVKNCGGYRQNAFPAEDYDLYLRIGQFGELANIGEALLYYRVTGGSIVGNQFIKSLRMYQRCIEEHSGVKFGPIDKLSFLCDDYSLYYYRKGLQQSLNGSHTLASWYFALSLIWNPLRGFRFLKRLVKTWN